LVFVVHEQLLDVYYPVTVRVSRQLPIGVFGARGIHDAHHDQGVTINTFCSSTHLSASVIFFGNNKYGAKNENRFAAKPDGFFHLFSTQRIIARELVLSKSKYR
jgi:hypothetical protein